MLFEQHANIKNIIEVFIKKTSIFILLEGETENGYFKMAINGIWNYRDYIICHIGNSGSIYIYLYVLDS